jgi:hypothetical protein
MKREVKTIELSQVLVAHTCNPSYSEGKDQEDHGLSPAWANSLREPIMKIPNTKKSWQSGASGKAPTCLASARTQI